MAFSSFCRPCTSFPSRIRKSKKKALNEVKGLYKLFTKFGVPSGAKVLDFSCGIGNHSIPLSNMGYSVVGYDPSSPYLKIAEQRLNESSKKEIKNVRFIQGDPYHSSDILIRNKETNFDAIIIMDNSFGYLGESKDISMLQNLFKVANRRCVLILETENRDWRLANFEPITFFESDHNEMLAEWKFNFETSVSEGLIRFYERDSFNDGYLKLSLKLPMLIRLYSLHELKDLISKAGWSYKESYDDIVPLKPFTNGNMSIFSVSTTY